MKKFKFSRISIIVLAIVTLGLGGIIAVRAYNYTTPVVLGTAGNFAVLAGSGITSTAPPQTITGDAGSEPTVSNGLTGASFVSGTNYLAGGAAVQAAKIALATAYGDVSTRVQSGADIPTDLAAQNLTPGIYHALSGTFGISGAGTLTLDGNGDPNSIFIFKTNTTLVTGDASSVVLTNGAQACNVFWAVGSSATLLNTTFVGTILAKVSITDSGNSTVNGRLLADADNDPVDGGGAVTLNSTTVTVPTCAPHLTLVKEVDNLGVGTATAAEWTLTASGSPGAKTLLESTGPTVDSDVEYPAADFAAATHTLSESGPSGYTASDWVCEGGTQSGSDITVNRGDNVTCTITNTFIPSYTLHVYKQVVNTGGGTAIPSDFSLSVKLSGTDVTGSPQNGDSSGTSYTLVSDTTYVVSEVTNASYTQSFSGNCDSSGSVTLDEDGKTCTITNTYIPPVINHGGGYRPPVAVFLPSINIISTPVVVAPFIPIIPKLPKTGFPPEEKSSMLPIVLLSGLSLVSIFLYFAQKKQTT